MCPLCGHDEEDLFHSLIQCDHARSFWEAAERNFMIKIPRLHPYTWSEDILDPNHVPKKEASLMITIMWTIWHSRNK